MGCRMVVGVGGIKSSKNLVSFVLRSLADDEMNRSLSMLQFIAFKGTTICNGRFGIYSCCRWWWSNACLVSRATCQDNMRYGDATRRESLLSDGGLRMNVVVAVWPNIFLRIELLSRTKCGWLVGGSVCSVVGNQLVDRPWVFWRRCSWWNKGKRERTGN